MRTRFLALLALSVAAVIGVGVALATPPSGLTPGPPHARGAAGEFRIKDKSMRLTLKAKTSTDVQIVSAKLGPNGFTGWHGHAGPSIAIVKTGQITMYAPTSSRRGDDDDDEDGDGEWESAAGCAVSILNAGQAFHHPEGAHNFVNTARNADGTPAETEFYIVYFIPAGASPAPIDVTPAPAGCPA
jgi:hypothetical protein